MERKLRTNRGQRIYAKRSTSVKTVFGQHVNRGCDRFLLRGKKGARVEWSLFSATNNLMKLWRADVEPQKRQVAEAITR